MLYQFDLSIGATGTALLKNMKGQAIEYIEKDDESFRTPLVVVLGTRIGRIFIRNNVDSHPDYKDEYVQFVVSTECDWDFGKMPRILVGKKINDIRFVTDYAKWTHGENTWEAQADIGILISLSDGEEILIEAVDSLAGFVRYHQGKDCLKQLRSMEEQWKMKTDVLSEARREIRSL